MSDNVRHVGYKTTQFSNLVGDQGTAWFLLSIYGCPGGVNMPTTSLTLAFHNQ